MRLLALGLLSLLGLFGDLAAAVRTKVDLVNLTPDIRPGVIYDNTVALFAYDDQLTIVKIENKNFADTFRVLFEGLWVGAKKTR